jgi:hypothetical protein
MIGSFSTIRSEFTPAEKILVKKLGEKTLNNAIDCCDMTEEYLSSVDNNNNYIKDINLFLNSIDQMPIVEVASLINKHIDKAIKKAELKPCDNCKYLAEKLQLIENNCNKAIMEENGSYTYFQSSIPENEQQKCNKTISQILTTEQLSTSDLIFLQQLEIQGKGELTPIQAYQQDQEKDLRKELDLMQNNK